MGGSRGGRGSGPSWKTQVAVGFLRNTVTDPLEKQFDPLCPIASRGRFVQPSLKYNDDYKRSCAKNSFKCNLTFYYPLYL